MKVSKPIRQGRLRALLAPFARPFSLTLDAVGNTVQILRLSKRGASRNYHRYAPLSPGLSPQEVKQIDRWWQGLSEDRRMALHDAYQDWVVSHQILSEISDRSKRRFWSLSPSISTRESALQRQKTAYLIWLSLFLAGTSFIGAMALLTETTPFFWLMSLCFLAFLAPEVARHRVVRAQILYGRRVSLREILKPLPAQLQVDPEHTARYERQYEKVVTDGVEGTSPVVKAYMQEALGRFLPGGDQDES